MHPGAARPRWRCGGAIVGLLLYLAACRPAAPSGEPAAAVQLFHAAMTAGDCAAALARLSRELRARVAPSGSCDALFQALREAPLERVIETHVDGRNRDAQLVRVRLRGRMTDTLIRVQAEGAQWKIFSM